MRLARIELGEQALFLGSAEDANAGEERRHRATFAIEEAGDDLSESARPREDLERPSWTRYAGGSGSVPAGAPIAVPAATAPAPAAELEGRRSLDRVREEIRELRLELAARAAPPRSPSASPLRHSRLALLYDRLTTAGLGAREALDLLGPLESSAEDGAGVAELESALRARMCEQWLTAADDGGGAGAVLVGPSGCGKTSAAARLAVRWGVAGRTAVRLISVDQLRVGAVEPLEAYAGLLGARLDVVDAPDELPGVVREVRYGEPGARIIIDTPGYAPGEAARLARLAAALEELDDFTTHLTIPAGLHAADLDPVIARYRPLAPGRLLFTRLDETQAPGAAWNAFQRLGLPVSYLSDGPRTPDDFRAASPESLTDRILPSAGETA